MTRSRALASIHLAAVLFGLTAILGELIRTDAIAITAGRSAFAVATLLLVLRSQGGSLWRNITPTSIALPTLAGALLAVHWVSFFLAVKTGGVAMATLGFASFPAFITLGERFLFREAIHRDEWCVLALVSLGLILVTPSVDPADQNAVGLAWGLFSGFSFGLFTLANRRAAGGFSASRLAAIENLVVLVLTLPFAVSGLGGMHAIDWFWLAVLGTLCTAFSHALLVASLSVLKARSAAVVIALEPVYAIGFAALLFGQIPDLRALAGGCLMVAAIAWSALRRAD
ncbi:MAG: DMT family transporter [Castellaniella sp.]